MSLPDRIDKIKNYLIDRGFTDAPEAALILGSGLGRFSNRLENAKHLPYSTIPHFPQPSVHAHEGNLYCGKIRNTSVIVFAGRFHHYEGFSYDQIVMPVQLAKSLDAGRLIVSNAAGAVNTSYKVGDLMVIEDLIRTNHAISSKGGPPYRYSHYEEAGRVRELAARLGLPVRSGTYIHAQGPSYETGAEIRAFRRMGADAVGMSTAPELMESARLQLKTAALSVISNMAAGITIGRLNHEDVAATAASKMDKFSRLVLTLITDW